MKDLKVLLVDDDVELRESLVDLLLCQFVEVHSASNGKEALEILRRGGIGAVLSDIEMPLMNGIELVKIMSVEFPEIIVHLHSGSESSVIEARQLGLAHSVELKSPDGVMASAKRFAKLATEEIE